MIKIKCINFFFKAKVESASIKSLDMNQKILKFCIVFLPLAKCILNNEAAQSGGVDKHEK